MMYNKNNPLRCFFAFEGYNSQGMGLNRLKESHPEFDWVCVGRSEIDKYAIQACEAVFPNEIGLNYGDISKIDWNEVPDFDLFTYSFPCQDISSAGYQRGLEEGSGTRSSLLWECQKAIEAKKPKYLLMENVKALVSKKFLPFLKKWEEYLNSMGYSNFTQVLNAKNYGVPQNRERVFMVSILNTNEIFHFPEPFKLTTRLKDVLEQNVDEKFYLSQKMLEYFGRVNSDASHGHNFTPKTGDDVAFTIRTAPGQRVDDNYVEEPQILQHGHGYVKDSLKKIAPSITSSDYPNNNAVIEPMILQQYGDRGTKQYSVRDIAHTIPANPMSDRGQMLIEPTSCAMRGRTSKGSSDTKQRVEVGSNVANCITTVQKDSMVLEPMAVGYTRDAKGEIVNRHLNEVAGCIKATHKGGSQDVYIAEPKVMCEGNTHPSGHGINGKVFNIDGIAPTLTTNKGEGPKIIKVGHYSPSAHSASSVVSADGISPTVMENHGTVTAVVESTLRVPQPTEKGYAEVEPGGIFDGSYIKSKTRRGRVQEGGKVSPALTAQGEAFNVYEGMSECSYRIRKLTPRECFRLMGVSDTDIDKIQAAGISNTQCYKMAGNSIVVDVLYHIFRKMFVDKKCESQQLSLF